MKVRLILIFLSLLAFASTSIGGYLYYVSLQESALREVERQAVARAQALRSHLSSCLQQNIKAARILAGLEEIQEFLKEPEGAGRQESVDSILDHFQQALQADVCYVMDGRGLTLASTNRGLPRSFVGENYAFRPYFQRAVNGESAVYMALGVTSEKRGAYYSHPVYWRGPSGESRPPAGVVVVKAGIDLIEEEFLEDEGGVVVLADPNGVVFASSRPDWVFRFLWPLPSPELERIAASRQFGDKPFQWAGLTRKGDRHAQDRDGNTYLIHRIRVHEHPGWQILYLSNPRFFLERVSHPLIRISGFLILTLCVIVGGGVFLLFREASREITRRRKAEEALRESEETALALLNAPTDSAFLLDENGLVLAANETAIKTFGGRTDHLVGSCAFDHFNPETAERERERLREVFRTGRPVRYEERHGNRFFDNNLYPVYDGSGKVVRAAIFSLDITERKTTEEELRVAQEELSRYSRQLERQVRQRTREITSILENTPAVVYIKDRLYRYTMVGSRFEKLFGVESGKARGRTDYEIFPAAVADQFRRNDEKVARKRDSIQVEERVPLEDGVHTYLSVKFPLKDDSGGIQAMCGISTDITSQKKAQEQLRRLSGRIMHSQEQERAAIARELHDELGQLLTALRMDAVWLRDHLHHNLDAGAERATAMCDLIDKTIDEVRGIASGLRPGVLDDLGLIDALEWFTEEFDRRFGVACSFNCGDIPPLSDLVVTAAYRIAQEALTNVARHASATHAEVKLRFDGERLVLDVSDDGKGMDQDLHNDGDCLGIAGMRERAALVRGSLEISSRPGKGTRVRFRVPVDPDRSGGGEP
jgi:PAS domain S-box-containing protein